MSSSVVELIWHFAGYLRLPPDDSFTLKILYDGGGHSASDLDDASHRGDHARGDLPVAPIISGQNLYIVPSPNPYIFHLTRPHVYHASAHPALHLHHFNEFTPETPVAGPSINVEFQWNILVNYQQGGDQDLLNLHQVNSLVSDNQMNAPADVFAVNQAWAGAEIAYMTEKAAIVAPGYDQPANPDTTGLQTFLNDRDGAPAHTLAADAPLAVGYGQYVDGSPYSGTGDVHQLTSDVLTNVTNGLTAGLSGMPDPHLGNGMGECVQNTSVGQNILANQALIANFGGGTAELAVLGNYNQTNAIFQTNVFQELNHYSGQGGTVTSDPNIVSNIADFQNVVPTLSGGGGGSAAVNLTPWNVTVLNGSLVDVHSITQTNVLNNDNVAYGQVSTGISQYILGGNELVNAAQFQNFGSNYNLIIVEGNYHQANLLYQTNVVLDANDVTFSGLAGGAQSVSADGNTIVNDGTILNAQNLSFQPFNQYVTSLIHSLADGKSSLDLADTANAFGFAGGINALVVTGDYYDVNYVSQMNVLANSNVVQMHGAGPANAVQNLITGHNEVVNAATLVDMGSAMSPYLQGNFYSDMILFQTNIIGGQANLAASHDPSQLAPEIAAFVTNDPPQVLPAGPAAPQTDVHHNSSDVLASVMH
ncbi:MAG TPA: hypothetical protein VKV96_20825 [Roseiarcus sp.]|nr:hypothetical protein [Roseiarcus sp.]